MIVFGIKNCGTVKKATTWLNSQKIPFEFHDYKKEGISGSKLQEWISQVGIDRLINRKGTTWRKLDDAEKEKAGEEETAMALMTTHTSLIKRPIIEKNGKIMVIGFDEEDYVSSFNQ